MHDLVELYESDGDLILHRQGSAVVHLVRDPRPGGFAADAAELVERDAGRDPGTVPMSDWSFERGVLVAMRWEDGRVSGPLVVGSGGREHAVEPSWRARRYIGWR